MLHESLLEEQIDASLKSKNQPRKLYYTDPDRNGARYMIDETRGKSRSSRIVKFEQIDLELYAEEARCIGFLTSADRLGIWIARKSKSAT